MDRLFDSIRPVIRFVTGRPAVVLTFALLLSVAGFISAQNLRIDTDFSNLIPSSYPSVQALEKLRDTVGSESTADVVLRSASFEANKTFAEAFIPRALKLEDAVTGEPYLTRVDYKKDTGFLEDNALYFATSSELDSVEKFLTDQIREAKLEANPFYFDLDDEEEVDTNGEGIENDLEEVYQRVVGKPYPVSEDSTIMVLRFYPAGSQTDIGFIERMYDSVERLVDEMNPGAYSPAVEVVLAGRLMRQLVEVKAVTNDVLSSFAVGVTAVLLLVVLYFFYKGYTARAGHRYSSHVLFSQILRTPVLAVLIGAPLLMSLSWTFGMAYLTFDTLNLMTSTLGLVLFGLGIDYGIHFYARYTEERGNGLSPAEAAEVTFASTGQAITVGALTTAAALYVLTAADFKGFSEFGFIAGSGIVFALLSMTIVLPALLVVFERFHLLNLESSRPGEITTNGHRRRIPGVRGVALASLAAVVASLVFLPRLGFEYDFGSLDPQYPEYVEKRDLVREVYPNGGTNPAYVIVDDPSEVDAVIEAVQQHAALDTLTPTIDRVESLQDRFPFTEEGKQEKLDRIAEIRELLNDPFVQQETGESVERLRRASQTTEALAVKDVPESIRNQFTSKSGDIGSFVMIYPSVGLSDGRQSIAFSDDVGRIVTEDGTVYHAASTSLVAADMLDLMLDEAPFMVAITLLVVIALMWANFGSIRWAALATLPLLVGILWMILMMELAGLKLNFYNLVVLPAVLGIGNDAGVHLVHRYREEGPGSIMHVLRFTGEHVAMGSITTIIGFGGLLLSFHPGLRSIGELAVVGIGMTLLAAVVFLPALLQWIEDRPASAPISNEPPPERESVIQETAPFR